MLLVKNTAAAFCQACFLVGLLLRLLPSGSARRCIKALAGLYILLVVLQAAGRASALSYSVTLPGGGQQFSAQAAQQQTIALAKSQLEQHYSTLYSTEEKPLTVELGLEQNGTVLLASWATVRCAALSKAEREVIAAQLRDELQVTDIKFLTEGDTHEEEN